MYDIGRKIEERLQAEGFNAVGIASAELGAGPADGLRRFLDAQHHGTMEWMADRVSQRADPATLWPDVKSVVVAAMNYGPSTDPMLKLARSSNGNISVYASGSDYHDVMKKRLKAVARWMANEWGEGVKVFVDTAPVMEKPLAVAAGIGWQGKHTNLVSNEFGSWLFLGVIFTTLQLTPATAHGDQCGTCHACLDVCPTNAFPAPYRLDARRCLSYLTIEYKGHIPVEFRRPLGNRIYGCDDCLAVCPWNKFAKASRHTAFHSRAELQAPLLSELAALDDASFRQVFRGSPVKRTGRDRFVRNVLIAIGNSGQPALADGARNLVTDSSPLVRAMAVWALRELLREEEVDALRRTALPDEKDANVREEWMR